MANRGQIVKIFAGSEYLRQIQGNSDRMEGMLVVVSAQSKNFVTMESVPPNWLLSIVCQLGLVDSLLAWSFGTPSEQRYPLPRNT